MTNQAFTAALAITLAFGVSLHAIEADLFCISHPLAIYCENPHAPLPEYAHELPNEPITPTVIFVQPAAVTANNSVHALQG